MLHAITVHSLTCAYNRVTALKGVTAEFPPGLVTALVGGNGSGKSTLLEAIAGTLIPVSGTITGIPQSTAFVPQRSRVSDQLPITVRRTVEMGRWFHRGALRRLHAEDHKIVDLMLERLDIKDLSHRRIGELSGGQRQRALIAQGLAQQAPLLLLDEPLSGIDSYATDLINDVIAEERARGTTIILATHDPRQAKLADQVIALERGVIKPQLKSSESIM